MSPPSYQYSFTGPRFPDAGYSYCTVVAIGYVAGLALPPPHGLDDAAFAGDHDLVGGGERLAAEPGVDLALVGDAELDVIFQERVEYRIGDLIADLIRMALCY